MIARILLGLVFFLSGLAGLLNLAKPPENVSADMVTFMNGMMATHYLFHFVKLTETVCGLLLLSGYFVPLALVSLAPVMLNIRRIRLRLKPFSKRNKAAKTP